MTTASLVPAVPALARVADRPAAAPVAQATELPAPPAPPRQGKVVIKTPKGDVIVNPDAAPAAPGTPGQVGNPDALPIDPQMIAQKVENIAVALFTSVAVIAIGVPFARAFARWLDRRGAAPVNTLPPDLTDRLTRIEQAVEAMSIEVERISEGQRFTTKLLSERAAEPAALPGRELR
ncbi:MAG: hypothetical protein HY275_12465 [Gemmatimonadetes bacterium]|nr:hypothetical protein [Gemmatimonadota bacterium]